MSIFLSYIFILLPLALLIFAWVGIGTPKILKRTAMLAIIAPLSRLLILLLTGSGNVTGHFKDAIGYFITDIIVCFVPFLCVFINVRRFDKSLSFIRALMFWLPE